MNFNLARMDDYLGHGLGEFLALELSALYRENGELLATNEVQADIIRNLRQQLLQARDTARHWEIVAEQRGIRLARNVAILRLERAQRDMRVQREEEEGERLLEEWRLERDNI